MIFLNIFFYWKLKITYISIWFFIFSPLIRTWLAQILLRGFNFFRKLWNFSIWFFIHSPLTRTWLAQILLNGFNFFRNLTKIESNIKLIFHKNGTYFDIKLKITYFTIRFFIYSPLTGIRLAWIFLRGFNFFRNLWKIENNITLYKGISKS